MRIINNHRSEKTRAIQQDYALASLRNTLELELDTGRRYGFRKYLRSLAARQAISRNINEYLTVLFIGIAAAIIITDICFYGAPAFLTIGIPMSTGAIFSTGAI